MKTINWGIIGCGDVTEIKSGPAFNLVDGSRLVAVMRRDGEKAKEYAQRHNVPTWYSNADEMLNDPDITAVYIATPPSSHKEYALKALAKGLPVYVEKPVTLNAVQAEQISTAIKNVNGKLTVAHYRRALPMFLFVKKLLEEKTIGEVRFISAELFGTQPAADSWRVNPAISGGGIFHDLAPHLLDLLIYYFGTPLHHRGYSLNQSNTTPADDIVSGQILFGGNILFSGTWNFSSAQSETKERCRIVGTTGSISFSLFGNDVVVRKGADEQPHYFERLNHIQHPMIEQVVKYFQGTNPNPCSLEEAIIVSEIMDSFTDKEDIRKTQEDV
jgi:predicted dehydrogenase